MAKTIAHERNKGDTKEPLNCVCYERDGAPVNWAASGITAKFKMLEAYPSTTAVVSLGSSNVTAHPTQTFTASATTDLLTCNGHGAQTGDQIIVATSTTLPAGLAASTRYFAIDVTPNAFRLSATPNGGYIDITDAGTGTHTFYVVGSVQYDFQSGNVDTAGTFRGFFAKEDGSAETQTYPPGTDGIPILIKDPGA